MKGASSTWRVQYYETDKMSIVHHSNYIRYFETARMEYIRSLGFSYADMEEMGIWMPVLGYTVEHKTSAVYDELLRFVCWPVKLKGASLEVAYEISNYETGEIHATGHSSHGFTTPELKPIRLKKVAPEIYEAFKNSLKEDR